MDCHRVTSCAIVSSNQEPEFVSLVCNLKRRVLSVSDAVFKILQINSQRDVTSGRQTVEVVVSEPELSVQISKTVFVRFPSKKEVNRAVQTPLKNRPTSTVRHHVTQHLYWSAAIWIDGVHATGCKAILKELGAAFGLCWLN